MDCTGGSLGFRGNPVENHYTGALLPQSPSYRVVDKVSESINCASVSVFPFSPLVQGIEFVQLSNGSA